MKAIYENDKTLIPAPIWENVDRTMKDEDFRNNPVPRYMMFEKYSVQKKNDLIMDYEKKYKNALEKAKSMIDDLRKGEDILAVSDLEEMFPELKESELKESKDERISKSIICGMNALKEQGKETFATIPIDDAIAWLEKQGGKDKLIKELGEYKVKYTQEVLSQQLEKQCEKMKAKSEVIKDYTGEENVWNNACDFRPKHMQRCLCYDKYMGGVYCYVYDDISKYWCTQTTEEHDADGDNHICDYADYRVTVWMCLPKTTFYPEKQGKQKPTSDIKYKVSASGSLSVVNGNSFDYEKATITQKDFVQKDKCAGCNNIKGCIACVDGDNWAHYYYYYEDEQKTTDIVEPKFKVGDKVRMKEFESFPHICTVENIDSGVYYCDFTNFDIDDQDGWELVKEPKFKVGDRVVDNCGYVWKIEGILNQFYLLEDVDGGESRPTIEWVNKTFHLWTIADAKNGDVIFDKSDGTIGIFQSIGHHPNGGSFNDPSYCFLHCHYDDGFFYADFEDGNIMDSYDAIPATKEQRDLLFQEMEEAGYEWDAEKKELKKIHVIDDGKAEMDYCFTKMMAGKKASPTWSEEDDYNMQCMIAKVTFDIQKGNVGRNNELIDWLKSLKDRVQPKQEWSEDDEKMCQETIDWFEKKCFPYALESENPARESIKWLKSLKGRITWKPSKEQMHAFVQVYEWYNDNFAPSETLTSLYNDLKKL